MNDIASELGVSSSNVALAWILRKGFIIPIIGARKVEQLQDNLVCVRTELSDVHLKRLDDNSSIQLGFPHDFIASNAVQKIVYGAFKEKIII